MLALATHEPHFKVLREDVFAQQSRTRLAGFVASRVISLRTARVSDFFSPL